MEDRERAKRYYRKVIEKCAKIIEEYPKAKFVDEALYLMGKSYLEVGEYSKARRKFEELERYFPKSKYTKLITLQIGKIYFYQKNYSKAYEYFVKAEHSKIFKKHKDEIFLWKIKIFYEQQDFSSVEKLIKSYLKKKRKLKGETNRFIKEAILLGAKASMYNKDFDFAINLLNIYLNFILNEEERNKARELKGDILFKKGKYEQAKSNYKEITYREGTKDYYRIQLKIAECEEKLDNFDKAEDIYNQIKDKTAGDLKAQAFLKLLLLYEKQNDFEKAKELLKDVDNFLRFVPADNIYKKEILSHKQAIYLIDSLKNDTTSIGLFKKAEINFVIFKKPEKAIQYYEEIYKNYPEDTLAPKSLFAIYYIKKEILKDTANLENIKKILIKNYPESIYAKILREY